MFQCLKFYPVVSSLLQLCRAVGTLTLASWGAQYHILVFSLPLSLPPSSQPTFPSLPSSLSFDCTEDPTWMLIKLSTTDLQPWTWFMLQWAWVGWMCRSCIGYRCHFLGTVQFVFLVFFLRFVFIYLFVCLCECMPSVCRCPDQGQKVVSSSGAGVGGAGELPTPGAENNTLVFGRAASSLNCWPSLQSPPCFLNRASRWPGTCWWGWTEWLASPRAPLVSASQSWD